MRFISIHIIILLIVFVVDVHGQHQHADTITTRFSMCETVRGDTVMFKYYTTYDGLKRFFDRNIRYSPLMELEAATVFDLYFIIDTTGKVNDAWCAAGTPQRFANEGLRVACKLDGFIPSKINGKPVFTQVEMRIVYYNIIDWESKSETQLITDKYKADIVVGVFKRG